MIEKNCNYFYTSKNRFVCFESDNLICECAFLMMFLRVDVTYAIGGSIKRVFFLDSWTLDLTKMSTQAILLYKVTNLSIFWRYDDFNSESSSHKSNVDRKMLKNPRNYWSSKASDDNHFLLIICSPLKSSSLTSSANRYTPSEA